MRTFLVVFLGFAFVASMAPGTPGVSFAYADDEPHEIPVAPIHRIYNADVTLAADSYDSGIPGSLGVGFRPVLSVDAFVKLNPEQSGLAPWDIGASLSDYTITNSIRIQRVDFTVRGGYWFLDRTLGFLFKLGETETSSDGFDGVSSLHYGAEIKYRIPLAERVHLIFNVGWTRYESVTLDHDTGIPETDDPLQNAFCSIFTFGLSNGCGDQIQTLNIPAANMVDAGVGIAILF